MSQIWGLEFTALGLELRVRCGIRQSVSAGRTGRAFWGLTPFEKGVIGGVNGALTGCHRHSGF